MKVPRSFSISGVSDMASLRVRGPAGVAFGVFKREQRWVCFSKPMGSQREPARRDGSLLAQQRLAPKTRGACASPGWPSRTRYALQKIRRNSNSPLSQYKSRKRKDRLAAFWRSFCLDGPPIDLAKSGGVDGEAADYRSVCVPTR
jgi:hypothetical protein